MIFPSDMKNLKNFILYYTYRLEIGLQLCREIVHSRNFTSRENIACASKGIITQIRKSMQPDLWSWALTIFMLKNAGARISNSPGSTAHFSHLSRRHRVRHPSVVVHGHRLQQHQFSCRYAWRHLFLNCQSIACYTWTRIDFLKI